MLYRCKETDRAHPMTRPKVTDEHRQPWRARKWGFQSSRMDMQRQIIQRPTFGGRVCTQQGPGHSSWHTAKTSQGWLTYHGFCSPRVARPVRISKHIFTGEVVQYWVLSAQCQKWNDNIASISHIGVRLFEHTHGLSFRVKSSSIFHTATFTVIPHYRFLTVLLSPPKSAATGGQSNNAISVTKDDLTLFQKLSAMRAELENAMKEFQKRQKESDVNTDS